MTGSVPGLRVSLRVLEFGSRRGMTIAVFSSAACTSYQQVVLLPLLRTCSLLFAVACCLCSPSFVAFVITISTDGSFAITAEFQRALDQSKEDVEEYQQTLTAVHNGPGT